MPAARAGPCAAASAGIRTTAVALMAAAPRACCARQIADAAGHSCGGRQGSKSQRIRHSAAVGGRAGGLQHTAPGTPSCAPLPSAGATVQHAALVAGGEEGGLPGGLMHVALHACTGTASRIGSAFLVVCVQDCRPCTASHTVSLPASSALGAGLGVLPAEESSWLLRISGRGACEAGARLAVDVVDYSKARLQAAAGYHEHIRDAPGAPSTGCALPRRSTPGRLRWPRALQAPCALLVGSSWRHHVPESSHRAP